MTWSWFVYSTLSFVAAGIIVETLIIGANAFVMKRALRQARDTFEKSWGELERVMAEAEVSVNVDSDQSYSRTKRGLH